MNTECTCVSKVERELAQLSFAMDDLRLFLDTHPCDKAALAAHEVCIMSPVTVIIGCRFMWRIR